MSPSLSRNRRNRFGRIGVDVPLWLLLVLTAGAFYLGLLVRPSVADPSYSWLTGVGGVMTCLALLLSILESRRLDGIQRSLSTRVVGNFPDNMLHITSLLGEARGRAVIMCDSPAYGFFSNERAYLDYRHKLQTLLADGIEVTMVVYDRTRSIAASKAQFGDNLAKIKKLPAYKRCFDGTPLEDQPKTSREFFEFLESESDRERELFSDVIIETGNDIPLYFWMVDGREAVFSFPTLSKEPPEVAFRTSDKWLIDIFDNVRSDVTRDLSGNMEGTPATGRD